MAKQTEKPIVAGLLLFFFIGLVAVAVQFMQNPPQAAPPKSEGFASAAPTRATDCSCLPGYVPSNKKANQFVWITFGESNYGQFIFIDGNILYVLIGTSGEYGKWNGDTNYFVNTHPNIPKHPVELYRNAIVEGSIVYGGGLYPHDEKITKKTYTKDKNFFCQSLSNPADIKQCY